MQQTRVHTKKTATTTNTQNPRARAIATYAARVLSAMGSIGGLYFVASSVSNVVYHHCVELQVARCCLLANFPQLHMLFSLVFRNQLDWDLARDEYVPANVPRFARFVGGPLR
jgi:hypothetical protein